MNGGAMIGISVTALMDINVMLVQVTTTNFDIDVNVINVGVDVNGPQSALDGS